jgi:hypothetical protein
VNYGDKSKALPDGISSPYLFSAGIPTFILLPYQDCISLPPQPIGSKQLSYIDGMKHRYSSPRIILVMGERINRYYMSYQNIVLMHP